MYKLICTLCIGIAISFASNSQSSTDTNHISNSALIPSPLERILSLEAVQFEYATETAQMLRLPKGLQYGISESSIVNQFPNLTYKRPFRVMQGKNRYIQKSISAVELESLVPVLVAALQEQQKQINQLRQDLERMQSR